MVAGGSVLAAGCVLFGVAPQIAITYLINRSCRRLAVRLWLA